MHLVLKAIHGPQSGVEHVVEAPGPTVVGRADDSADIVIAADGTLSRSHFRLYSDTSTWHVRDLDSRNGTFVNGTRIDQAALKPGDRIRAGACVFLVTADSAADEVSAPPSAQEMDHHASRHGEWIALIERLGYTVESVAEGGTLTARHAAGHLTQLNIDAAGRLIAIESPSGRCWRLQHDESGRMNALIYPTGASLTVSHDDQGRAVSFAFNEDDPFILDYDDSDRLVSVARSDHLVMTREYADSGQLVAKTYAGGHQEAYHYSDGGDLQSIEDAAGNELRFTYGPWDRPVRVHYPDGNEERYGYDASGRLQRVDGTLEVGLAYRDESTRPSELAYPDQPPLLFSCSAKNNSAPELTVATSANAACELRYDDGRIVEEQRGDYLLSYRYDDQGRFLGYDDGAGRTAIAGFGPEGRIASITTHQGAELRWRYGNTDRTETLALPNSLTVTRRFDRAARLTEQQTTSANGDELFSTRYDYDNRGNLRRCEDSRLGTRDYEHDELGRVLAVSLERKTEQRFAFDACGNCSQYDDDACELEHGYRLLRQGASARCSYDQRGRLIGLDLAGREWQLSYDSRNHIVAMRCGEQTHIGFRYDAFGRRIALNSATENGEQEVMFHWAGERLIGETRRTATEVLETEYVYADGAANPIVMRRDDALYCCHHDQRGAVERITDGAGELVWESAYSVFGVCNPAIEKVTNPWRLPGHYQDSETGLCYVRWRYYAPALGRFCEADPAGLLNGTNPYLLTQNQVLSAAALARPWRWPATPEVAATAAPRSVLMVPAPTPKGLATTPFNSGSPLEVHPNGLIGAAIGLAVAASAEDSSIDGRTLSAIALNPHALGKLLEEQ